MRMAFDTILSDYVDAETAAKSGGGEPYRYKCACCWEEGHLCAADSQNQATHFRLCSGNNNVECENYLGNRSVIIGNALSHCGACFDSADLVPIGEAELTRFDFWRIPVLNIQTSLPRAITLTSSALF